MYKYIFGPVPSRRLGMSLGVDLVPKKICSLDCVYCEVGKTTELTLARKEYINTEKIKEELANYFANNANPDYITFSGFGEPTLNTGVAEMIQFIKKINRLVPIALITNGTTFFDKKVRNAIKNTDLVLPSLDAATENVFQKINRPPKGLSIKKYIQGLIDFRKEFKGEIWLEIFILPGYNDTINELAELKKAILKIKPDSVQLNTLDRPGTIHNLRGATRKELHKIIDLWKLDNVEIIAKYPETKNRKSSRDDVEAAIIEIISRRPCTLNDLTKIMGLQPDELNKHLYILGKKEKIKTEEQERGIFYQLRAPLSTGCHIQSSNRRKPGH